MGTLRKWVGEVGQLVAVVTVLPGADVHAGPSAQLAQPRWLLLWFAVGVQYDAHPQSTWTHTHTHTHTHTLQSAALLPNVWRWRKRWVTQAGTQRGLKYPKYSYHAGLRAGGHFSKTRSIHNIASSVLSVHVLYAAAILHWNTKLCENTELN